MGHCWRHRWWPVMIILRSCFRLLWQHATKRQFLSMGVGEIQPQWQGQLWSPSDYISKTTCASITRSPTYMSRIHIPAMIKGKPVCSMLNSHKDRSNSLKWWPRNDFGKISNDQHLHLSKKSDESSVLEAVHSRFSWSQGVDDSSTISHYVGWQGPYFHQKMALIIVEEATDAVHHVEHEIMTR